MTTDQAPSSSEAFRTLIERYHDAGEAPPQTAEVSLSAIFAGSPDPSGIVGYLSGLSMAVRNLDDLLGINALEDEEELSAFAVAEGVAISIASQGSWILFRS